MEYLRNNCPTGYDNIPTILFKSVTEFLVLLLTFIINNYIKVNNFSDNWKTVRISPIPKIAEPMELKGYRPVPILPVLSKVYEKLVLKNLAVSIE